MAELTYTQLLAAVERMETVLARNAEGIRARADKMEAIADDTAQVADTISAKAVDTYTVAETQQLAKTLRGVGQAVRSYAAASDTTARIAKAAAEQARRTHSGIKEQFGRA
ncbi:hypothetical protein, partial [Streptomyces roseoviridis]